MLWLNKFFDRQGLYAFTSDASVDFTLDETAPFMTKRQRECLSGALDCPSVSLAWAKQVHGADVIVVDQDFINDKCLKEADALVTDLKDVLIAVRTADCLPIFIWDPVHEAMGIVHAGWKSTHKEIVRRTLEVMAQRFETRIADVSVAFGPAIRSCCYEVSSEFKRNFPYATFEQGGRIFMDLAKANRDQLWLSGIDRDQLFDCRICTVCSPGYFSYRRDGDKAGRMISGLMLRG